MSIRPATLSVAAGAEALEGAAMAAAGLYVGVETVAGSPHDVASSIALAVFALIGGAALLAVACGLWQVRRWGRAPALLTQIFIVITAIYMIKGGQTPVAVPLIAIALIGAIALLSPPSTQALLEE